LFPAGPETEIGYAGEVQQQFNIVLLLTSPAMNVLLSFASGTASDFAWFQVGHVVPETVYLYPFFFNEI
jgi:hypothetical protein